MLAYNTTGAALQKLTVNGTTGLTVEGGNSGTGSTAATIQQLSATADQQIDVKNGSILVQGGTDQYGFASIFANNTQEIGDDNFIGGNVTVQGGGTTANTGAYAAIYSTEAQSLDVTGNLNVLGSLANSITTGNNNYALVKSGNTQAITVNGSVTVNAEQGSSDGSSPINTAGLGAAILAQNLQTLKIGTLVSGLPSGPGMLSVLGSQGELAGAAATIATTNGDQEIDVYGKDVNGNSILITGGTGSNAYASIVSGGGQFLGDNFSSNPIAGKIVLQGGTGEYSNGTRWRGRGWRLRPDPVGSRQ